VHQRSLDPELWFVHEYEVDTGAFLLVRSVSKGPAGSFSDQFLARAAQKKSVLGSVFARSAAVQMAALSRAKGKCELCGELGFEMANGAIFLETHHVISLADDGPDEVWNVVALCPNDHRRAHYAKDADLVRDQLLSLLESHFPGVKEKLLQLVVELA
jgi:5-methylcytosine-specific restriction protein A